MCVRLMSCIKYTYAPKYLYVFNAVALLLPRGKAKYKTNIITEKKKEREKNECNNVRRRQNKYYRDGEEGKQNVRIALI